MNLISIPRVAAWSLLGLVFCVNAGADPKNAEPASEEATPAADQRLPLESVRILALDSPKRAVIKLPGADGPRVVEPGDVIEEARATVASVGVDKLVVETVTDDLEPARLRAWIYRPAGREAPRVLRLDSRTPVRQPDRQPVYLGADGTRLDGGTAAPVDAPEGQSLEETVLDVLQRTQPTPDQRGAGGAESAGDGTP